MLENRKNFLNKELFILDQKLRSPLLNIRQLSFQISRWELISVISDEPRTIEKFNEDQEVKRVDTSEELQKLEKKIRKIVFDACHKSYESFLDENRISTNLADDDGNDDSEP